MSMAQISQLDLADASAEQRAAHDEELRLRGRMTNMKRTLMHSPVALRVYGEWFALRDELAPVIGDRAILTLCLAISTQMDNTVGIGFMRRGLAGLAEGDAPTQPVDLDAMAAFGTAFAADPKTIPADVWARLREKLPERTLVDLTALAGIMVATNSFMDAVGTEPDPELAAFTTSRPG
ncbi:hypothetical protein SAMN03080618_00352 [Aquamicrobium aerolatum DSM 21857]|uniref:Alkylhydroperoxidase family enzyme, contains CxxC motif n=2 Tax=Aerobium TaxID=3143707 RepID=A0A1I3I239_9HYPH|nr:hypothetical protein SAMN03080618_00352 [Aquamicrobium aerolatum DSM 21857]